MLVILVIGTAIFFYFYSKAKDKNSFLVMVLILLMPLQFGWATGHAPGNGKTINAIDLLLIFMLLRGIPKGITRKKIKISRGVFLPGVLFIFWAFLSMILASKWKTASAFGVISCIRAYIIGYYIINFVKHKRDIDLIIKTLIFSLLFICTVGIAQYFTHSTLGLGFLGSWGMRAEQGWLRATGTFQVPNVYAAYMIFLIPIILAYSFLETNKPMKLLIRIIYVISVFALIITFSRSSWLGFIVSTLMFLSMYIKNPKLRKRILPMIFTLGIVSIVIIFRFWDNISARALQSVGTDQFMDHRKKAIDDFSKTIKKVPLLGTGQWAYITVGDYTVHITVLRIAAELGIPGLIFFLWILKEIYKVAFKVFRAKDKYLSSLSIGIICGFSAFLILSCFNPTYRFFSLRNLFWFLAGLLMALRNLQLYYLKLAHYHNKKRNQEERLFKGQMIEP